MLPGAVALGIGALMAYTPLLFLRWLHKRYIRKFTMMLPDTLSIMSRAIKAGHGIETALSVVVKSTPYPVNEEFKKAIGEMQLGLSLQNALQNLYRRMESEELKILVTGITIQQELGGNLSEILGNLEATMRERFAMEREVKALSAQGIMAGWGLAGICAFLMLFLFWNDRDNFIAFLGSPAGKISVGAALMFQAAGFFIIFKMVKVKD
jgi:tight adherence protein B